MQFLEAICRTPGGTTPANWRVTLRSLLNNRAEFRLRGHVLSSHEHISTSKEFLLWRRSTTTDGEAPVFIRCRYSCLALAQACSNGTLFADCISPRRGGRAVDCAGLENRKAERSREFESHPLRSPRVCH